VLMCAGRKCVLKQEQNGGWEGEEGGKKGRAGGRGERKISKGSEMGKKKKKKKGKRKNNHILYCYMKCYIEYFVLVHYKHCTNKY
jgi:hypothetical protein